MEVVRAEEPAIKASSFEILRSHSSPQSAQGVSGYVEVGDDETAFETIKDFWSGERLDKVIIVYKNYAFSLVDVTFSSENKNQPCITLGRKRSYTFQAKDVHLEALSGS
ncbi:MAG: hypothetical protein ACREBU_25710 [Nitrososphaera sp.]